MKVSMVIAVFTVLSLVNHADGFNSFGEVPRYKIVQQETIDRPIGEEYDFIVIGSGPGGATVASRLSEVQQWSVLLCEAGEVQNPFFDVPGFIGISLESSFNWKFVTERQPGACLGVVNERCVWSRGRCLGGTTCINSLTYTRGVFDDYNAWADLGNKGWSAKEIWPYFLKSENNQIPEYLNSPAHKQGGLLNVERNRFISKIATSFLKAAEENGYPIIDFNNGTIDEGASYLQQTMSTGERVTSARAFLEPAQCRKNLHIATRTRVTKILINKQTNTACGVEYLRNGQVRTARARKEVILSAGTLQSPQLLMLSGVGPADHLKELGIPVLKDLKVGYNLQDHALFSGLVFTSNYSTPKIKEGPNDALIVPDFLEYIVNRTGILSTVDQSEALLFIKTKHNNDKYHRPDIELLFRSASTVGDKTTMYQKDIYHSGFRPLEGLNTISIRPFLLLPKSIGRIKLKDNNIESDPLFYGNYLDSQLDLETLVEGTKAAVKLMQAKEMEKYDVQLNKNTISRCEHLGPFSDEYWRCAVRLLTAPGYHQIGTCKMGVDEDAVVDPQLRVRGIHNLRVVDASIMPTHITAHTMAPIYMIGEVASDLIKKTWQSKNSASYLHVEDGKELEKNIQATKIQ